jgi:hypothetical protein
MLLRRHLLIAVVFFFAAAASRAQSDLTGAWSADDGGIYYLRQIGDRLWWAGFSTESPGGTRDFNPGIQFSNVFQGRVAGNRIVGDWADVPRGQGSNSGSLTLEVGTGNLRRLSATGGFGATVWQRTSSVRSSRDIFTIFDRVKKNQKAWRDHSLLDNLKPAKSKPVAVFGRVVLTPIVREVPAGFSPQLPPLFDQDPVHVNYRTHDGRSYRDFVCIDNKHEDGDLNFQIRVIRSELDAQVLFWSDGWETSHGITPDNFRAKLDQQNQLHVESIMYGGTTECGDEGAPVIELPGWQQPGANGVLLNGQPIAGQLEMVDRDADSARVNSIRGRTIRFGTGVRVTGILVLDCGHGATHPCDEDNAGKQNQEIHPVYALDLLQDWSLPRPFANLTGVWGANDAGTYYVREIGPTVWWLGLSVDEGRTFANVFRGTLQSGRFVGEWADVPLGGTSGSGTLALTGSAGDLSTNLTRASETGGFSGQSWRKLHDAGGKTVVVKPF